MKNIRLIIEDHEDVIYWGSDVSKDKIHELIVYIIDELRKKYSTDTFSYRDAENKHYELHDIGEFEISPVFIAIPHRKDIHTYNTMHPRTMRNFFTFKDPNTVKVEKVNYMETYGEFELTIDSIRTKNEAAKTLQFEDPILSADVGKLTITIQQSQDTMEEEKDSPTFGNAKTNDSKSANNNGFLKPDEVLKQELDKKQKIGVPNSQNEFVKMTEMNKYPLGKKVELQMYTLEDVKAHNRSTDAWMVINGKVYDVTKYIPHHPGKNKILMGVGKDGTSLYNEYHPWVNANYLLEKYQVGFLKK